jgi:hypothetical protein
VSFFQVHVHFVYGRIGKKFRKRAEKAIFHWKKLHMSRTFSSRKGWNEGLVVPTYTQTTVKNLCRRKNIVGAPLVDRRMRM